MTNTDQQNTTQKTKDWSEWMHVFRKGSSSCSKPGKYAIMYTCTMHIDVVYFYDFAIGFWKCSDSVVCFAFISFQQNSNKLYWWQAKRQRAPPILAVKKHNGHNPGYNRLIL
jgi:hypothetical protein